MGNRYWPLRHAGQYFAFTGAAVDKETTDKQTVAASGAVGGLLGAAVAIAITRAIPETEKNLHAYTLDIATGRIADYAYLERLAETDTAVVYLYRRYNVGPPLPVSVLLDGQPVGELGRDALLRLPWTSKTRELTLTIQGPAPASFSLIPSFTQTNYCEVTATADDPRQLRIKHAPTKDGEYFVPRIQKRMAKR